MQEWNLEPARDLGLPLRERMASLRRENGLIESAVHLCWGLAMRGYLRMVHRFEVLGRERLPAEPPFVLVANHSSHLDAPALTAALPWRLEDRTFPLAAGDTFFEALPAAAFAAFFVNALPIWRRDGTTEALLALRDKLLLEQCVYILFPEGTRTRDGHMGRFRPGVGMFVAGTPVPVVPCYLEGAFRALPPHSLTPRLERLRLHVGQAMTFPSVPQERAGWIEIAAALESAVRSLAPRGAPPL